jgi:molecular chaperone GrpE
MGSSPPNGIEPEWPPLEVILGVDPEGFGASETVAALRDRWMRAEAEVANVRARARRDTEDARLFAVQRFAADVVQGVDDLHRGLETLPPPEPGEPAVVTRVREGVLAIERSFLALLQRNGIERDQAVGVPFDVNRHQAIAAQESPADAPGTVVTALSPGWSLHGRLLRPAMVVVAKAPVAKAPVAKAPVAEDPAERSDGDLR